MLDRISLHSLRHIMCYVGNICDGDTSPRHLATHTSDTPLQQRVDLHAVAQLALVCRRMRNTWRAVQRTELLEVSSAVIRGTALRQLLFMVTYHPGTQALFEPVLSFARADNHLAALQRLSTAMDAKFVVPKRPCGYTDVDCILLSLANARNLCVGGVSPLRRGTTLLLQLICAQLSCSHRTGVRMYGSAVGLTVRGVECAMRDERPFVLNRTDWRAFTLVQDVWILRVLYTELMDDDDDDDALVREWGITPSYKNYNHTLQWITLHPSCATLHRSTQLRCAPRHSTEAIDTLGELSIAVRRALRNGADAHLPVELFAPCLLQCSVPELVAADDSSTLQLKHATVAVCKNWQAIVAHEMLVKLFVHTFGLNAPYNNVFSNETYARRKVHDLYGCELSDCGIVSAADALLHHNTLRSTVDIDDAAIDNSAQWHRIAATSHISMIADHTWLICAVRHQRAVNQGAARVALGREHTQALSAIWSALRRPFSAHSQRHTVYWRRVVLNTGTAVATLVLQPHMQPNTASSSSLSSSSQTVLPLHCVVERKAQTLQVSITLDKTYNGEMNATCFLSHLLNETVSGDMVWYYECLRCLSSELRVRMQQTALKRREKHTLLSFTLVRAATDARDAVFETTWHPLSASFWPDGHKTPMRNCLVKASLAGRMRDALPLFDTLRARLIALLGAAEARSGDAVRMQSFCDACMHALASTAPIVGGCASGTPQCPGLPPPSAEQKHLNAIRRVMERECDDSTCLASPHKRRRVPRTATESK